MITREPPNLALIQTLPWWDCANSKALSALGISSDVNPPDGNQKETPAKGHFWRKAEAIPLCSVLRGKVALGHSAFSPRLIEAMPGRRLSFEERQVFETSRNTKSSGQIPCLSYESHPSRTSGVQEYLIRVDCDLFRREDNRPRANPRPARDKLKRASVEPVSGTEKGLSVVG